MTLEDLGNTGEFVAAIAVVASLIYLAMQIRQNTSVVLANTQQTLMDAVSALQASVSEHPDLPSLLIRANEDPDSLSPEDSLRFEFFATRIFGQYETIFFFYGKGLMPLELWEPWDAGYSDFVQSPGFRKYWAEHSRHHHESFRGHVDTRVYGPDSDGRVWGIGRL